MSFKLKMHKLPSYLARGLIYLYQITISPFLGKCCRFYPSCSDYGLEAFRVLGFWKGLFKTIVRIGKCHPWHPGGYDPVENDTISKQSSL